MENLGKKALYLSKRDVESLNIPIPEIIDRLEMMFIEKAALGVEMPPKQAIHTNGDAFLHAMPAFIPKFRSAGMKWVGGYPENYMHGLPYITGLLVLNDVKTGVPYAVMDCIWITAVRTAAATALTAKYLARRDSKTLAILGCGIQGRYNLEALNGILQLSKIRIYDIAKETADRYQADMQQRFSLDIDVAENPQAAVLDADVIVTAGPFFREPKPVISHDWIKPGALVCPLDLDSYVKPDVFVKSDFLCTDDRNQFNQFKSQGLFQSCPEGIAELCDVIAGKIPGRENDRQIVTAVNIGLALEDMAVAPLIFERAKKRGVGISLDL